MKVSAIIAIKNVFSKLPYLLLCLIVSALVFTLAILAPNFSILFQVLGSGSISVAQKIEFIFKLLGGIKTNFSLFSATLIILSALLFGINFTMVTFYLKHKRHKKNIKKSFLGTFSGGFLAGVMGVGCAVCGSLFLSALLPILGLGGILVFFPFGGREFGILGVILLSQSFLIISRQIASENICKV